MKEVDGVPGSDVAVARDLEVQTEHGLADKYVGVETGRQIVGDVDDRRQFDATGRSQWRRSGVDVQHAHRALTAATCTDPTTTSRHDKKPDPVS